MTPRRALLVFSSLLGLLVAAVAGASVNLEPLRVVYEGAGSNSPREVVAGDFDHDGHQDVVVAGFDSGNITLLLGDGRGGLTPARSFPVGRGPKALAVGDIDQDGGLDLVVGLWSEHAVAVMRNDGQGVFIQVATLAVAPNPSTVALGDLNGDGSLDLVVGCSGARSVEVHLGCGDGAFGAARALSGDVDANNAVIADLDGDSHLDVAASDLTFRPGSYSVPVWFGRGDGSFEEARRVATYNRTSWIQVADFDKDGHRDVILAGRDGDGLVSIARGRGLRSFELRILIVYASPGYGLIVADLSGDGWPDVWTPGSLYVGTGAGGVQRGTSVRGGRYGVEADLDADGVSDVVASSSAADAVFTFSLGKAQTRVPTGDGLATLGTGDLDRDGRPELILWERGEERLRVLRPAQPGWTVVLDARVPSNELPFVSRIEVAELTGDGWPDVLAIGGPTFLFRNDGAGGLLPGVLLFYAEGLGTFLEDIDKDGALDLVDALRWRRMAGGGLFEEPQPIVSGLTSPIASCLADVNGDGLNDLVVMEWLGTLRWFPAKPTGGFEEGVVALVVAPELSDGSLRGVDLDGDGVHEVVSWKPGFSLRVYFPEVGWSVGERPTGAGVLPAFVDADADGVPDVLYVDSVHPGFRFWHPQASLVEDADLSCLPLSGPTLGVASTTLFDVDGDGRDDLVMSLHGTAKLACLRSSPVPVPPGDLDASGVTDVLDLVLEAGYIVGNVRADQGAFRRSEAAADLDGNAVADVQDLVLMANLIAGNICP